MAAVSTGIAARGSTERAGRDTGGAHPRHCAGTGPTLRCDRLATELCGRLATESPRTTVVGTQPFPCQEGQTGGHGQGWRPQFAARHAEAPQCPTGPHAATARTHAAGAAESFVGFEPAAAAVARQLFRRSSEDRTGGDAAYLEPAAAGAAASLKSSQRRDYSAGKERPVVPEPAWVQGLGCVARARLD